MSTRQFFIRPGAVICGVGDAKSPHCSIVLIFAAARSVALSTTHSVATVRLEPLCQPDVGLIGILLVVQRWPRISCETAGAANQEFSLHYSWAM